MKDLLRRAYVQLLVSHDWFRMGHQDLLCSIRRRLAFELDQSEEDVQVAAEREATQWSAILGKFTCGSCNNAKVSNGVCPSCGKVYVNKENAMSDKIREMVT